MVLFEKSVEVRLAKEPSSVKAGRPSWTFLLPLTPTTKVLWTEMYFY